MKKYDSKDVSVLDISKMKMDINLAHQRNLTDLKQGDVDSFNNNLLKGFLHQSMILVDTKSCYKTSGNPVWKSQPDYLIIDGNHRFNMIIKTLNGEFDMPNGLPFDACDSDTRYSYVNAELTCRIIKDIDWDDLPDLFIANNSGSRLTKEDVLAMLNTKMSNKVIRLVDEYDESIFTPMYGENNGGRRKNAHLRQNLQMLFWDKWDEDKNPDFGVAGGGDFYKYTKIDIDKHEKINTMLLWMEMCVTAHPKGDRKRHSFNGALILNTLLDSWEIPSYTALKSIYKDYVDTEKDWLVKHIIEDYDMLYKDALSMNHGRCLKARRQCMVDYCVERFPEWKSNGLIVKK
jgi:hypothetical protein